MSGWLVGRAGVTGKWGTLELEQGPRSSFFLFLSSGLGSMFALALSCIYYRELTMGQRMGGLDWWTCFWMIGLLSCRHIFLLFVLSLKSPSCSLHFFLIRFCRFGSRD